MLEVIRVKLMGWFQIRREQGIVAMEEHRILSLSFLMRLHGSLLPSVTDV
jgi:hypothetical protein